MAIEAIGRLSQRNQALADSFAVVSVSAGPSPATRWTPRLRPERN